MRASLSPTLGRLSPAPSLVHVTGAGFGTSPSGPLLIGRLGGALGGTPLPALHLGTRL